MPTLLEYINQLQRDHRYRVKMVFTPTERQLESMERHLKKYDALEVSRPEKLMLQSLPPDFPGYGGHEVILVDVVTRLPASPYALTTELRSLLMVPEGTLKVFSFDEPLTQQEEAAKAEKGEYKVKTGADYTNDEANPVKAEDVAGDVYVEKMLQAAAKDDRRKVVLAKDTDAKASGPELNSKISNESPFNSTNTNAAKKFPLPTRVKGK